MMKRILVLGAGRSATVLINYLLNNAESQNWHVVVGDISKEMADEKVQGHSRGEGILFNIKDQEQRESEIQKADIVVSLLPAAFHYLAAKDCVTYKKNMVTASYVAPEIKELHEEALANDILLLQEIGVDPGIDHMSAMKEIDAIKAEGGEITSFKSFTGGLVAPEFDTNPWGYKFTWNPMNVVTAGQGVARFIRNGRYKYIPYHKLFTRVEKHSVLDMGEFEGYANRDSLSYRDVYGIPDVPTLFRGTFRKAGYCSSWNLLVQLGLTDNTFQMENVENMTWRDYINSFLVYDKEKAVEDKVCELLHVNRDSEEMKKLEWLGLFTTEKVGLNAGTPAEILLHLLQQKWSLEDGDKDMIVMQHIFEYTLNGENFELTSSLVVKGDDELETAMAKTVGLPAAIAAKFILNGEITSKGVVIPTTKDIYLPVLEELKEFGITFVDELRKID